MEKFGLDRQMTTEKYLNRMKYKGTLDLTLETLSLLQHAHVSSVPYENLDIMAGIEISLSIPALYDKIVHRKRGGYCFELNGLFAWLLMELGFDTVELQGRWLKSEPIEIPLRRHRVSRTIIDGKQYICDVGVGLTAPKFPLLLEEGLEQEQEGEVYRIVYHPKMIWVVQELLDGKWSNFYSFSEEPQIAIDYYLMHYHCVTYPKSIFRNSTMVYVRTEHSTASYCRKPAAANTLLT